MPHPQPMTETIKLAAGGRRYPVVLDRVGAKSLSLHFQYNAALVAEIKRSFEGSRWDSRRKRWLIRDSLRNRIQLDALQGRDHPEIQRYLAPLEAHEPARALHPHQRTMMNHALTRRRCVWAAEMGCGKTLAAIEVMEQAGGEWWYVGPKKTLSAIDLEFDKWAAKVKPTFFSYAAFRRHVETYDGAAPHGVIFDESSKLKTPTAGVTQAARHLVEAIRDEHDGYVILMTGTPAPLAPTDWWSPAELACPGFLTEASVGHLLRRLAILEEMDVGGRVFPRVVSWKLDEVELLKRRLEGLVLVVLADDVLDLPPLTFRVVDLPPAEETLRAARLLAATSSGAAQALNKCRQLSDGFQYTEEGPALRAPSPKDDALRALLDGEDRIVISAGFLDSVDRCVDICRDAGWDVIQCDGRGWKCHGGPKDHRVWLREMDRGTRTDTPARLAFVCQADSGGMGFTLHAARRAICYSNSFKGESRMQFVKRIHRLGMGPEGAEIVDLCHLPTDRLVLRNHETKKNLQDVTLGIPLSEVMEALSQDA